jgi:hypothetical protein
MQNPVTINAVVKRVRRAVEKKGQYICTNRSQAEIREFGLWTVWNISPNTIDFGMFSVSDLETFAREIGALRSHECVAA